MQSSSTDYLLIAESKKADSVFVQYLERYTFMVADLFIESADRFTQDQLIDLINTIDKLPVNESTKS